MREVLLDYFAGISNGEIARMYQLTPSQVSILKSRGIGRIRQELGLERHR